MKHSHFLEYANARTAQTQSETDHSQAQSNQKKEKREKRLSEARLVGGQVVGHNAVPHGPVAVVFDTKVVDALDQVEPALQAVELIV